ncbi:hypothetical protein [Mariniflexile sp.]|uniref:hypothetical protein n=1 Tax=Mariniflexile sp. TaxID=1979402 RepID=UPI0035696BCB
MKFIKFTFCFLLCLLFSLASAQIQSIRNGILHRDTDGNRIQAHGVSIMKHNGVY